MAQENQKSSKSPATTPNFSYQILNEFFEKDNHLELRGLSIAKIQIIPGKVAKDDVYLLIYQGSPNISIYNSKGRLVDIDHYLPAGYKKLDLSSVDSLLNAIPNFSLTEAKKKNKFDAYIDQAKKIGRKDFFAGVNIMLNLSVEEDQIAAYIEGNVKVKEAEGAESWVRKAFPNFLTFLRSYIVFLQQDGSGYVHITSKGNIIITPVLRRSGLAVIIETQNSKGELMKPQRWNIVRTNLAQELEQTLVFRTQDVQSYFESNPKKILRETVRYQLFSRQGKLAFDSLLDNTDNLLEVNLFNNCYQVLVSDEEVVVILSEPDEITIVNAHRSIVPQKWARTIQLSKPVKWMRADQNINTFFVQLDNGDIEVLDIGGSQPVTIANFGSYKPGFEIDQLGSLLVTDDLGNLIKIKTNVNDLESPSEKAGVQTLLKNISHLFKGDQLFSNKQFAKIVELNSEEEENKEKKIAAPILEKIKFDFETNVEHRLAKAGGKYEALIKVKNSIAMARENLSDELTTAAEKAEVLLVGQKLQKVINSVVAPIEDQVNEMVELARSKYLLEKTEELVKNMGQIEDPYAFRDILNKVRTYKAEFDSMHAEGALNNFQAFSKLQARINQGFASQMATDDGNLKKFISGEIEQIEKAINKTHDPRQLEMLLGTHPAALELMNILKQPYVLRTIAKDQTYSPAAIQSRLFGLVEDRKKGIRKEVERANAERKAAKEQLALMTQKSIEFFVDNHSGSFSLIELGENASYQQLQADFNRVAVDFSDLRLANELRRRLERRILERTRKDLEKIIAFEGKYAFIQNDPDLFVDEDGLIMKYPDWKIQMIEKKGADDIYQVTFVRSSDYSVHRPSVQENLLAGRAYEIKGENFAAFWSQLEMYNTEGFSREYLEALWAIINLKSEAQDFPQFASGRIENDTPTDPIAIKALRCALEIKLKQYAERTRIRKVPEIAPDFIDETPYFKAKLNEFVIKAKLQLTSGTGIVLLTGPPSTGKSTFLKFAARLMNREYFEHAADKWQTKNSLVTAIKFGEFGPYATPASFTQAITTPHSLINIEEIKEWPEALRKSLNPFFGGSKIFVSADGTQYDIGQNILLCAAANLGSMYRQEDEPFTADFWSRIEVVEYDYAPEKVEKKYIDQLFTPSSDSFITISDMVRSYFGFDDRPKETIDRAAYFAKQFVEFIILPKTDEQVKRNNIQNFIEEYFQTPNAKLAGEKFSPEEAAKIVIKRVKALSNFSAEEFFDLYDHFINEAKLRTPSLRKLAKSDVEQYNQIKIRMLIIRYVEGSLRYLREKFYATAGQTEVEGTNREFIKCVLLLDLIGKI